MASHNSGKQGDFFKNLKKIIIGSEIFYQTNYGTKRYVVTVKEIIDEENWSYLQPTEDNRITLITCVAGQKLLCTLTIKYISYKTLTNIGSSKKANVNLIK